MDTLGKKTGLSEGIRLISVLLFFLFLIPGLLLPPKRPYSSTGNLLYYLNNGFLCLLFIGLEFMEYFRWSYRYGTRRIRRVFFLIRFLAILIPPVLFLSLYPADDFFWHFHLNMSLMFLGLLPFYAYFAFPRRISLIFLIIASLIPLGYEVFLKGMGEWDLTKLGFMMYRTLTFVFFYVLAWLLDRQNRSLEENRQLLEELRESESRLREYAGRIAHTVALEERTRIARDIHDSLGHSLTAIKIQLTKAIAYAPVDRDESDRAVKAAKATADDAMSDVRESLKGLNGRESIISLKDAFPLFVNRLRENGIEVTYTLTGEERDYNYSVLMGLYRFVQEGVTNILKHASPGQVILTASFGPEEGEVCLSDDGKGFVLDEKTLWNDETDHYGLKGLIRRIELVRGRMTVESAPGKGTTLCAVVPRDPVSLLGEGK